MLFNNNRLLLRSLRCAILATVWLLVIWIKTTQNALRPSTIPRWEMVERSSMTPVTLTATPGQKVTVSLPRAQDATLRLIIVVWGPESVLPDVLAIHTIEMIPKSMILTRTCWTFGLWYTRSPYKGVAKLANSRYKLCNLFNN